MPALAAIRWGSIARVGRGRANAEPNVDGLVERAGAGSACGQSPHKARWRAVNAPHLVALVGTGAVFEEGKLLERDDRTHEGAT